MIESAANVPEDSTLSTDICIVGAGAAGITLALALQDSGLQILLLESGSDRVDKATQELYAGEVADPSLHSPPLFYRQRRFGGSTTIWGGRCVPFDPQDFEQRDSVPGSGWPIGYDDVARHYPAATLLCEAGTGGYRAAEALGPDVPSMFGRVIADPMTAEGLERFSCPTDFGARYRIRLASAKKMRLLFGANCVGLDLSASGDNVSALQVATLGGRRFRIEARAVVIAAGGLETPRLLLASRTMQPDGIGNFHGAVGRYYMCHLAGSVGSLALTGKPVSVRHGYERTAEGIYCRRRLALTQDAQRLLGVANLAARLHFPAVADPSHGSSVLSGIFLTRRLLSHEYSRRVANGEDKGIALYVRHVANVLRYPHDAFGFLTHWMLHHNLAPRRFPSVILKNRSNRFSLEINSEQIPLPESRVTLVSDRDSLGMQRIRVDWRYARADIKSVERTLETFSDSFERSGIGQFSFDREQLESDLTCFGAYGGHHIGTTRMGTDPRTSVVDKNCRVHGVDNLYVAGSAVFPTSSQANPTLTLVALSLRLAEHLSPELGGKSLNAAAAVR